jgi:hypothetical protein
VKTATLKVRLEEGELELWKGESSARAMGLSKWVRETCNANCGEAKKLEGRERAPLSNRMRAARRHPGGTGQTGRAASAGEPEDTRKSPGKSCIHGVGKGWNCWQCGGLAVIQEEG